MTTDMRGKELKPGDKIIAIEKKEYPWTEDMSILKNKVLTIEKILPEGELFQIRIYNSIITRVEEKSFKTEEVIKI